jgi:high-affinity iron transporter
VAFTDHGRAIQRSPLALYQVISQGLSGTAMPSFAGLPAQQRWDLAFYVGGLSADDALRARGKQLWGANAAARAAVPDLASLAQSREDDLAVRLGAENARAITAYLRANPGALAPASPRASLPGPTLAVARQRLAEAVESYDPAQPAQAAQRALSAYLDGIEPIEPTLATRDPALLREIEAAMSELRTRIQARAPVGDVRAQADAVRGVFDRIEVALADKTTSSAAAFAGSFTILVREGLEALLIVVGMLAFLRKAQRADAIRYVHAGWVGALLAGAVTWAAATYLVGISGANREVTEGLSSLFAALVLLSVGIWMHGKSAAGRWQQYLSERMSAVLTGRSAMFLFGLSFIAVYREVFETILFYAAMWTPQDSTAIVGGLAAGIGLLAVIAWALLRAGMRLPVGTFFSVSAVLIAILAVVLAGKGTAALQEAGWISQTLLHAPRVDWLGLYPTAQSLTAQLVVAVIAGLGYLWAARAPQAAGKGR